MKHGVLKFTTVLLVICFFSCIQTVTEPSFYYWKTKFKISSVEKSSLKDLGVKELFIKFFDVDISKQTGKPVPLAVIEQLDSVPKNITITPVVFITNRTFFNLNKEEVIALAKNIFSKINSIKNNYAELQFDCDWSGKTRENYFLFLEEIKKLVSKTIIVTCTIRLHQVKYAFKTGIPPVKRGVLMFYNIGNLNDQTEKNSIYNKANAIKYSSFIQDYPLPLDAALPIFKWFVHYRNNSVIGLINKNDLPVITDTIYFLPLENNTKFSVQKEHLENGIFYRTNDILKSESISNEQLIDAAQLLKQNLKPGNRKIIFYDLDENNIKNYDKETFTKIMAVFN